MSKTRIVLVALGTAIAIPGVAFASHVANCCGDALCCLLHLGCC
jgi:hypothetical protein